MNGNLGRIKKIHLIGIGGVGMSGIAEVLLTLGFQLSGSDLKKNSLTIRLESLGVIISYKHAKKNIKDCDLVVFSSAIDNNNPELQISKLLRIPVMPRAEMLAELMRFKYGIAIAGTHGKTTTTSLVASIFKSKDPTFVIGGKLLSLGLNAKIGESEYFIAEADESDASFLHLSPTVAVVTNIDNDHLSSYDNDFNKLKVAFLEFIHKIPLDGLAVVCIDDQNIREMLPNIMRPFLTYGFSKDADLMAKNWQQNGFVSTFELVINKIEYRKSINDPVTIIINLAGKHNVLNTLAAIAVALESKISISEIKDNLIDFKGIGRRMEVLGEINLNNNKILFLDDYGHHPIEIQSVMFAIKKGWPSKRLVMIFQPHKYSRTRDLFEDFSQVLAEVDVLILLEVYAAGEDEIPGADTQSLLNNIRLLNKVDPIFVADPNDLHSILIKILQPNDLLVTQGAGDVTYIANKLLRDFNFATPQMMS